MTRTGGDLNKLLEARRLQRLLWVRRGAEVLRAARYVNVLLGAWIALAPWVLAGAPAGVRWHDLVIGALVILLSFPRGPVRERYGSWRRYVV